MIKIDDKEIKMSGNKFSLMEESTAIFIAMEILFPELRDKPDWRPFLRKLSDYNKKFNDEHVCEYSIKRSEVYGNLEN